MRLHQLLESSKLTKLKRYIYGLRGNEGLAIISPHNPHGKKISAEENKKRMAAAKLQLQVRYPYMVQSGIYGGIAEKSFVILDIPMRDAIKFGRAWEQESIIYIEPGRTPDERQFEFIRCFPGSDVAGDSAQTVIERIVRRVHNVPHEALDNMSIIGGNKYVIPFFDERSEWEGRYGAARPERRKAGRHRGHAIYSHPPRGGYEPIDVRMT